MKFKIVSANAQIRCIHGGTVQVTPSLNKQFQGIIPLCVEDIIGASIVGCPVPQSNSSKPCQKVVSLTTGQGPIWLTPQTLLVTNALVKAQGLTDGFPQPATWSVEEAGQVVVEIEI